MVYGSKVTSYRNRLVKTADAECFSPEEFAGVEGMAKESPAESMWSWTGL